jgi:clathrin heavy chain
LLCFDVTKLSFYRLSVQVSFKDPRALIHVCDRFDFVDELTRYLYGQGQTQVIDIYLTKMNPGAAPVVIGSLLDLNCAEDYINNLLLSVPAPHADPSLPQGPHCPIGPLVAQVEQRNRLTMLRPWLEARMHEKNVDPELHNALAKIYIDINFNASHFLANNPYYDSKVVGQYCESRDPHLAFIAYKRANGSCDDELIHITSVHGFFKDQARVLVERQSGDLWDKVLVESNPYRRQLIDQIIATALPESRVAEEVVCTVQAFMRAQLPNELIELLEKIVLHSPKERGFHNVKNLQNLLILTAIKADKKRVMQYVTRLDNFDGPSIAKIALEHDLFEEGFTIFNKFKLHAEAIDVLLHKLENMQRAADYADVVNEAPVWSLLATAQLNGNLVKESIASFVKAVDASIWERVIVAANEQEAFADLISYLKMAREKIREPAIDNEMIVCFAKTDQLSALEDFIMRPNCIAKIEEAGDRCYDLQAFQAARILYSNCNNQNKLALAWIQLRKFPEAVEAARKANALPTWKAVCFACVDAKEFRLAQICGSNIIVYHAHLHEVTRHYETQGFFDEVIQLLEQGINLDRAHQGIFTELGVMYSKYKEEKLMEHIKLFWSKLNIPTLLASCRENLHWPEAVFLYMHYDQYDNAVDVLMEHSAECWSHEQFKEVAVKSSSEKHYQAVEFYLSEHPLLLSELLIELSSKLDHSRAVSVIRDYGHLSLIQKYLLFVQRDNIIQVNEAVNQLFIEEDNHKALRESIDSYDQFDQIALAKLLERHDLMDFRRIAAYLYKLNKRFTQSIELSKKDGMWQDAMECAAESKDQELAEKLLRFFVDQNQRECFSACLFNCYELIRGDVVLELAWRFNLMSFAMPFMIQTMRDMNTKLNKLAEKLVEKDIQEEKSKEEEEKAKEESAAVNAGAIPPMMPNMMMPGMMPPMMGMQPGGPLLLMGPAGGNYGAPPMMPVQPPMFGAPMGGFGAPPMGSGFGNGF